VKKWKKAHHFYGVEKTIACKKKRWGSLPSAFGRKNKKKEGKSVRLCPDGRG